MADKKFHLIVVVNGDDQAIEINPHEKVESLMREALREAGIHAADLSEWRLRFEEGGSVIGPDQKIADAGIANDMVLYLDPDEGGGGMVAAVLAVPPRQPPPEPPKTLVDPAVSQAKVDPMLSSWREREEEYRARGWLLLGHQGLDVEVAFACRLPVGPFPDLVTFPLAVRFRFHNFDVWPPSVELIDPLDLRPLNAPRLQALDFSRGDPQQVFIGNHPKTGRVFLCKRGVREYHNHFQHDGDDWLLHRGSGLGTLEKLCTMLWQFTTRSVIGLDFQAHRIDVDARMVVEMKAVLAQGDIDALREQARPQLPQQMQLEPQQLPPEIAAQLLAAVQGGNLPSPPQ